MLRRNRQAKLRNVGKAVVGGIATIGLGALALVGIKKHKEETEEKEAKENEIPKEVEEE